MDKLVKPFGKLRKSFKKLPHKYRLWVSVGILLALLVALPITLIGFLTGTFELRKRAVTGEPTATPPEECLPVDKTIYVSPLGEPGNCHDLQRAIDNVTGDQFTIQLAPGTYVILDTGESFSIQIVNKNDITIQGDPQAGPEAVNLQFPQNRGGIYIENSSGSLKFMDIKGSTSNGLVYITQSFNFNLAYLLLDDQGANTVQINQSTNISVSTSEIRSSSVAIYPSSVQMVVIANNLISDSAHGVEAGGSSGDIKFNLFENNSEQAIELIQPSTFNLIGNTVVGTQGTDGHAAVYVHLPIEGSSQLAFEKNIVVLNNGGIEISEADKLIYNFNLNDVWSNARNYIGIPGQTGLSGNISADPLFGDDYCLLSGSPAIYGDVSLGEYMGYTGPCPVPTSVPCGDEGEVIPSPERQCCSGLMPSANTEPENGYCPLPPEGEVICTKCGIDGRCGLGENRCNCPIDCTPYSLSFKLKFEGVTSRPLDDSDKEVQIYATSYDGGPDLGSATNKETVALTVDDSGTYHGEITLNSSYFGHHYRLRIKGPKHLQAVFPDVIFQEGVELDLTDQPLRPGDLNLDSRVDKSDLQLINERIFSTDPTDLALADVNFDQIVDIIDRTLVLNTLSVYYDPD